MRFSINIIALFILFSLSAQSNYDLKVEDKSLADVVRTLSKQYSLKFSYSPRVLSKHRITRDITAKSRAELISQVFEELPFELKLSDGIYLVIPKKIKPKPTPLIGQVYDNDSGEPLAFAHVQSTENGTLSSQNGRFSLPPREDTITLTVSYIGYKNLELKVPPNEDNVKLRLNQNPQELKEVVLTADIEK
ncbi:MAG: carboxypeptidase-like regulatory domain-containing protein [Ekhidna sp.]